MFVSDQQIAAGELEKRSFKAVFLPMGLSLGKGEKAGGLDVDGALSRFIDGGGLAVATDEPEFDEFLAPSKAAPALMKRIKRFQAVEDSLGEVLTGAGARAWTPVTGPDGKPVPGLSVRVHRLNGNVPAYIVTLLRRPIGKKQVIGADGVLTYKDDPSGGNVLEPCSVDISSLGATNCTAIRTGEKLPVRNGRVRLQMPDGDGLPLAVLPYAVKGAKLAVSVRARNLHVSWQLVRKDGKGDFAPHAVRVEVGDAGGQFRPDPALSRNATCDAEGAGALVIPLADEDAGRTLTISLKDILTGARAAVETVAGAVAPSPPRAR